MQDWCLGLAVMKRWLNEDTFEIVIILLFIELTFKFKRGAK